MNNMYEVIVNQVSGKIEELKTKGVDPIRLNSIRETLLKSLKEILDSEPKVE